MKNEQRQRWQQLVNQNIVSTPYLLDEAIRQWGEVAQNVINHRDSYNNIFNGGAGPIEKHPYIETYADDFAIRKRDKLILGPFPSRYGHQVDIDYYFGDNPDIWYYFFGIDNINLENNAINYVRTILQDEGIAITDVFQFVQRRNLAAVAVQNHGNLVLNSDVSKVLKHGSKVKTIFLLSGDLSSLVEPEETNVDTTKGFYWILQEEKMLKECTISGDVTGNGAFHPFNVEGINAAIQQQNNGIIWWIKYKNKKVKIVNLPNPSPGAAMQMINVGGFFEKWVVYKAEQDPNIPIPNQAQLLNLNGYMNDYPGVFEPAPTRQYRREVYQMALNGALSEIYQANNLNP